MNRRNAIKSIAAGLGSAALYNQPFAAMADRLRGKTILVLSGWQFHNIGDIAHTPGLLQLLNTFLPECRVILWKQRANHQVEQMLKAAFPGLKVVHGDIEEGSVVSESLLEASKEADFLLHGSGPSS